LLDIHYKDTGSDAYPHVRANAPAYFENLTHDFHWAMEGADADIRKSFARQATWVERGLFKLMLEQFDLLPITTDSHFGEYIQWAWDVVDHQGILDFYRAYEFWCAHQITPERVEGTQEGWTIKTILEDILTNSKHEEAAVNVMNDSLIDNLPGDIAVEVPAIIDSQGVHGIHLGKLPKAFSGLLNNQYAVHDLTAEAILTKSKKAALQALLVDPVVTSVSAAEQTLDMMFRMQNKYLGYLK